MRLFALTAVTMLAFAGNSVLNRMAVGGGMIDAVGFAAIRVAAGAVLLALLVLLRHRRRGLPVWPGARGRATGVAGLSVYLFGFSLAYLALEAGTGALVLFGTVQVTLFGAAVVLGEAVPPRRWAGAGLAFAGLAVLLLPVGAGVPSLPHVLMMVAAGAGWGVYTLSARGGTDPLAATASNFVLAVPVAAVIWLVLGGAGRATGPGVALAVLSGAVTSGLGYALWYAVLPRLGSTRAAVAQLTVPLITAAGGLVVLAEAPDGRFAAAAALIPGGVALAVWPGRQLPR
jgi:drug/metabolite transporter (DMT)-like permease